jgi:hypothetical protein
MAIDHAPQARPSDSTLGETGTDETAAETSTPFLALLAVSAGLTLALPASAVTVDEHEPAGEPAEEDVGDNVITLALAGLEMVVPVLKKPFELSRNLEGFIGLGLATEWFEAGEQATAYGAASQLGAYYWLEPHLAWPSRVSTTWSCTPKRRTSSCWRAAPPSASSRVGKRRRWR